MASLSERIQGTHEWIVFATQPPGPGQQWSEEQLAGRELLLTGDESAEEYPAAAKADVLLAQDGADATLARTVMEKIQERPWCLGLDICDRAALCGRGLAGLGPNKHRDGRLRDQERKWRHYSGRFVNGWQPGVKNKYFRRRAKAAVLPPDWNASVEVPYGLRVGNPLPIRAWGDFMMKWPLGPGLGNRNYAAYALWCAAHSLFAQDAAKEYADAVLEHGRLWYMPPGLREGMRRISPLALAGGDGAYAEIIDRLLFFVGRIRWHFIDPVASTLPSENDFGGLVFANGDCVPFSELCVDVVDALWVPLQMPVADECRLLRGRLGGYRTKGQRPRTWTRWRARRRWWSATAA